MDKELEIAIDEVRLLWNALVERGEQLHAHTDITISMRAVLEYLSKNGPTNVPNIARARRVTRQHVQSLANALSERGYVATVENPAHKRSPLIRLTESGDALITAMRADESRLFEETDLRVSPGDLRHAASVLRALREAIGR